MRRRIDPKVAARRKSGFGVPVERWVTAGWRDRARSVLRDSLLVRQDLIQPRPLKALLDGEGSFGDAGGPVWSLMVLESWLAYEAATDARVTSGGVTSRLAGSAGRG